MPPEITERLIAERYALGPALGRGGMGVVWRATDTLLQREVAVKEVHFPEAIGGAKEREAVEARVLREARAAAGLNHPAAVAVYDVIQDEGRAFIVMELVEAPTLGDLIKEQGPIEPQVAAEIGLNVLDALEAAHDKGIVHRDVKPANVMVARDGAVKLADFGIASVKGDPRLTASGMILGSPSFMSPEQAQEGTSTPATDLWALGATLYYAVEGKPPFDKGQPIPTLTAVLHEEPEFTERADAMRPVIERLLSKDPSERPGLDELRSLLQDVVDGRTAVAPAATQPFTSAPAAAPAPAPVRTEVKTEPAASASPPRTTPARRPIDTGSDRRWLWGLALGGLLLAAAVLFFTFGDGDDPSGAPERAAKNEQKDKGGGRQNDTAGGGAEGETDPGEVPEGWVAYTDDASGYSIAYPEGWEPISQGPNTVDFTDPDSGGTYMRVEWTDSPGDDVVGTLEDIAASFSSSHDGYEELALGSTDYQDFDAGIWEYLYSDGIDLHATNLQFVTDDHGFALNFQTPAEEWDEAQEIRETFESTFRSP